MNDPIQIKDSIFRIGRVYSVEGRVIKVLVDKSKNSSHLLYRGDLVKNVSVGGYVKIIKGFTPIIGVVEGEYTNEDVQYAGRVFTNARDKVNRILRVSLLGYFDSTRFKRGIKEMPLVDNECYLLDRSEFASVHEFVDKENDVALPLGSLALEQRQKISIGINSLFASHVGIFGNTGSGKSYTLSKLYYELFNLYKDNPLFQAKAKFVIIDFNGEYVDLREETSSGQKHTAIVDSKYKRRYILSTEGSGKDRLPVPKATLQDCAFWKIILQATEKTQAPFLQRAFDNDYFAEQVKDYSRLRVVVRQILFSILGKPDKEITTKFVFDFLSDLQFEFAIKLRKTLQKYLRYNNKHSSFYWDDGAGEVYDVEKLQERISSAIDAVNVLSEVTPSEFEQLRLRIILKYYEEVSRGHSNKEHLSPLIKRMENRFKEIACLVEAKEVPSQPNLTIICLKEVGVEMKKILPLLLCKQLYEDQKKQTDPSTYLNIIVDEAHNILSTESFRETTDWKDYRLETFEEIIKEGRKFGVFLTLASQRPSDISPTIISQLHNYFLHRLINNNDINAVEKSIAYLDRASFEYLPILPRGTCILAGLAAQVPVLVEISRIPVKFEPDNKTRGLIEHWIVREQ